MIRPRVVVSVTSSVDGRVTLGRDRLLLDDGNARVWRSLWPPGAEALDGERSADLRARHGAHAILEGSGSLVPDRAGPLTGLPEPDAGEELHTDFLPADVLERPGHESWFTVVDGRGRVHWTMKQDGGLDVLVLVARATPAASLAHLRRERICYLVAGADRVDLAGALRRMRERLGVTCVVSAAGGGLNGALLRAGLVDEIEVLVLPAVIGGLGTPSMFDGPELTGGESPVRLRLLAPHTERDGAIRLRYEVLR